MRRDDLLDLNDSLQHPGRKTEVDISTDLTDEADIDLVKPLEGYIEAVSTGNLLLVKGTFKTTAVVECARCGSALEKEVEFEVDEQFSVEGTPSSFSNQDFARVVSDEPYPLFDGNSLMVEALLRQDLVVALPVQPLCDYGWDGPCPIAAQKIKVQKMDIGRPEFAKLANLIDPEDVKD
ncbi:MAG TPA: DUF177 domain-containing protein [Fimbriimonadaceae bacterium]|nr:DUF177 domain-containing protein [Fimbriimonadaceae bacterium]